jgi:hypothetical protein
MKYVALIVVCLAAVVGTGYVTHPDEFERYAGVTAKASERAWEAVEANPAPVLVALGTFLLTVVYHKTQGKSLRESVEVAATRVQVVAVPAADAENPVIRRAKARATRAQLIADQIGLENRYRKLPEAVVKAEKEACYTEQALADAERAWEAKQKAHDEAVAALEAMRKELAAAEAELTEIDAELKKLAEVV